MFPQLGAPLGLICSGGVFLLLSETLSDAQFFNFGWRIPFLASSLLVFMGLYVRLRNQETPAFQKAIEKQDRDRKGVVLGTSVQDRGRLGGRRNNKTIER